MSGFGMAKSWKFFGGGQPAVFLLLLLLLLSLLTFFACRQLYMSLPHSNWGLSQIVVAFQDLLLRGTSCRKECGPRKRFHCSGVPTLQPGSMSVAQIPLVGK